MKELKGNAYPGRGIVLGCTPSGNEAVIGYFIMGRSVNSRNRVFVEDGEGIRTEAKDPKLLEDPSLIIYSPVRALGDTTVVTNGDQTDTVYDYLKEGKTFEDALTTRAYEPDEPNFTPRISGVVCRENDSFSYKLSILKHQGGICLRQYFHYEKPQAGVGHLIHTYCEDGNPLPSFKGEPKCVEIMEDMDAFTKDLWDSLDEQNRISLFVRFINVKTGEVRTNIINGN